MSHLTMSQFASRRDFEAAQAAHNGKQLVTYAPRPGIDFIVQGTSACVQPLDHPDAARVSNTMPVNTSTVQWYNTETGVFETLNTRYVPSTLVN